jgi:hypothetical protein
MQPFHYLFTITEREKGYDLDICKEVGNSWIYYKRLKGLANLANVYRRIKRFPMGPSEFIKKIEFVPMNQFLEEEQYDFLVLLKDLPRLQIDAEITVVQP